MPAITRQKNIQINGARSILISSQSHNQHLQQPMLMEDGRWTRLHAQRINLIKQAGLAAREVLEGKPHKTRSEADLMLDNATKVDLQLLCVFLREHEKGQLSAWAANTYWWKSKTHAETVTSCSSDVLILVHR